MASVGIQETLDVLDAVQSLTVDAITAFKEHGVALEDITVVMTNLGKIKTAIEGIGQVPAEIKDVDLAELKVLINKAIDMVDAILKAVKLPKTA